MSHAVPAHEPSERPSSTVPSAFGAVLRRLRDERRISQEDLAAESGVARSFIAKMETGRRQPTISTLFKLAEGLSMAPSSVIEAVEQERSG